MSDVKKLQGEILGLMAVLVVLGSLWLGVGTMLKLTLAGIVVGIQFWFLFGAFFRSAPALLRWLSPLLAGWAALELVAVARVGRVGRNRSAGLFDESVIAQATAVENVIIALLIASALALFVKVTIANRKRTTASARRRAPR